MVKMIKNLEKMTREGKGKRTDIIWPQDWRSFS